MTAAPTRRNRLATALSGGLLVAVLVIGGSSLASASAAQAAELKSAQQAQQLAVQEQQSWLVDAEVLGMRIAADALPAQVSLDASAGKVLDESHRSQLQQALSASQERFSSLAEESLDAEGDLVTAQRLDDGTMEGVGLAAAALGGERFDYAGVVDWDSALLAELTALVDADVVAWQAEQDRLAAEAEAARVAAGQAAAEEAARQQTEQDSWNDSGNNGGQSGGYYVHVGAWGAPGADSQGLIDACMQVAIDYGFGVGVAAHNYCDSTALSLQPGDLVTFSGALSGTYVVTGSMVVATGSSSDQVSALGTSMFMYTCLWGSSETRAVGLAPA